MRAGSALVLATVVADWIPEKGRRDGVKGLPFGRWSPVATASTGTLIFDGGTFASLRACLFNS